MDTSAEGGCQYKEIFPWLFGPVVSWSSKPVLQGAALAAAESIPELGCSSLKEVLVRKLVKQKGKEELGSAHVRLERKTAELD